MKSRLAALVALLGVAATGCGAEDDTPAPATKKALAAVAVDDLGIRPTSYDVAPDWYHPGPLKVELRWHPGGDHNTHRLGLDAVEKAPKPVCPIYPRLPCESWPAHGGVAVLTWQTEAPEEDPGLFSLDWWHGGELHSASYSGEQITGDPRKQENLPVSVDDVLEVLTDSRFGVTSTRAMVDADLAKWPKDESTGDIVRQTPQGMAARLNEMLDAPVSGKAADASGFGAGAIGVTLHYRDRDLTVVQVPVGAKPQPTCAAAWSCREEKHDPGVFTGWRPGAATAVWTDVAGGVTVVATEHDGRITKDPRHRWFIPRRAGSEIAQLFGWRSNWSAYELKANAARSVPWFE